MQNRVIYIAALLAVLLPLAYCFTAQEIEIFQLQNELSKKYGEDIDFYKFLKLPQLQQATTKEIKRNLRTLSKKYHPDKNVKYKKLYERLNKATRILTDESLRKTYDYYLKNGFPDYDFNKGGFFFKRVQPKIWFTLLFIYIVASAMHYATLLIQFNSNKNRIETFIQQCKAQDTTNGLGERRLLYKKSDDEEGNEILLRFGSVYHIEHDGSETLISSDSLEKPTVYDSMFFLAPKWIKAKIMATFRSNTQPKQAKPKQKKH